MANLFSSSIGRKLLMSLSGLFLITFLLVHLLINSFLLLDGVVGFETGQLFNAGAHFMATNPLIKVVEPVLGIGFLVHIVYSLILTLQNRKARGNNSYGGGSKTEDVSFSSKNMLPLGVAVLAFLVLHLSDYYVGMKGFVEFHMEEASFPFFGTEAHGHDAYAVVNASFGEIWRVVLYVIGGIALGLHLVHGFWSAFQTIGWNNQIWMKRLKTLSYVCAYLIGGGFSVIALAQFLFFQS